jgi:HAD superfamily hydrolase (TIGR01662 family)
VDECWHHACEALAGPAGIGPPTLVAAIVETGAGSGAIRAGTAQSARTCCAPGPDHRARPHALGRADEALAAAIAQDFAERRWERMTLFPGVTAALEALRARGVPLAMVTNGDATHQRRKIAQHDLERFFDVIVVEGEMGVGKPEEVVYRYALSELRVKPEEAWMVGDNLEWDVLAPQRLGLRGIWVDGPGQGLPKSCSMAPHRIIRAFPELVLE